MMLTRLRTKSCSRSTAIVDIARRRQFVAIDVSDHCGASQSGSLTRAAMLSTRKTAGGACNTQ